MKTFFVVNYNESKRIKAGVQENENGICDVAYSDELQAINQVKNLVESTKDEIEQECNSRNIPASYNVSYNDNCDYGCIRSSEGFYEYWVTSVIVEE